MLKRTLMLFARGATTVLAMAGLVACTTHSVLKSRTSEATKDASMVVVTSQELDRIGRQISLMEALERVRPSMLVSRGTRAPWVSVDGFPLAELAFLRTIPASSVREVRLRRSSSSVGQPGIARNGDVIVGDVIAVATWGGGRRR
jgi:hypothetical protein